MQKILRRALAGLLAIAATLAAFPAAAQVAPSEGTYRLTPFEVEPALRNAREVERVIRATYPRELRAAGVSGVVQLRLRIAPNGRPDSVTVVQSSHPGFDSAAVAVARRMRFRPAEMEGRPVAAWVELPITFEAPADPAAPAGSAPRPPARPGDITAAERMRFTPGKLGK